MQGMKLLKFQSGTTFILPRDNNPIRPIPIYNTTTLFKEIDFIEIHAKP
jgi:hypothetical protein